MGQDSSIWDGLVTVDVTDATIGEANCPPLWRRTLADKIVALGGPEADCLEAGSAAGFTSLLLPRRWNRTMLDYSAPMIQLGQAVFAELDQPGEFVEGDMFDMPFGEDSFDIVFNSGVLEHYESEDRARALSECRRVLRPGGHVAVGIPNHYFLPYSIAYRLEHAKGRWLFPDEFAIRDLREEVHAANLTPVEVFDCDPRAALGFLRPYPPLRYFFAVVCRAFPVGGYLRVIVARRD